MSGMKVERNARVLAEDGEVGRVTHVVVDHETREVTEIVVARADGEEELIPITAVAEAGGGTVRLHTAGVRGNRFVRDEFHGLDDERADAENTGQARRGGAPLRDAQDDAVVIDGVAAAPMMQERIVRRRAAEPAPVVQPVRQERATPSREAREGEIVVPVTEERLSVEKRAAEVGEVRVRKTVTEEEQTVPVELQREEVTVRQQEIAERPLRADEAPFQEGTVRIPVRGEEAMVNKETVVTGEVVLSKEQTVERQEVADTVRREQVVVDDKGDKANKSDTKRPGQTGNR